MGLCIALGEKFFNSGVKDVDDIILPDISSRAAAGISSRVFPGYATLFRFVRAYDSGWPLGISTEIKAVCTFYKCKDDTLNFELMDVLLRR